MNNKLPSNKNFGITFSVIFFILAFFISNVLSKFFLLIFSFILLLLAFFKADVLKKPNLYWFKFGILLSSFFNPIIMTLIYVFVFIPISIFYKFRKNNTYILNYKNKRSSWIERIDDLESMDNQF